MKASLILVSLVCAFSILWVSYVSSQELPPLSGDLKVGVSVISEDGSSGGTMEAYNVSEGLTLNKLFLIGRLDATKTIFVDVSNVNRYQRNVRLELMGSRVFNIRLNHTRMRNLPRGEGGPEFAREFTRVSGSVTPEKWLKMYGGVSSQQKSGDRVTLFLDGADVSGSRYDYSIRARNLGAQLRHNGRNVDVNYEWRQFDSDNNGILNRDGKRLRVSVHAPITRALLFSGSYHGDRSVLENTSDALLVKSYSGILTAVPSKRLKLSGYVDLRDADNELSDICSSALKVGGESTIELHRAWTTEIGYEYTRREDELRSGSDAGEREVSSNAFIVGLRARPSDKTRVTVRYRTRSTGRDDYADLTGPFDTDNLLARLESWPMPHLRLAVALEDKERSNDDLMTSGRSRGVNGSADIENVSLRYRPSLRLSGSFSRNEFEDPESAFTTDNLLLSARLHLALSSEITIETGITHIEIRRDLDVRKDIALASMAYEFMPGYAVELRYDLFSYDDFIDYRDNFAANVFSLSFSKKFGPGDNVD